MHIVQPRAGEYEHSTITYWIFPFNYIEKYGLGSSDANI